MAKTKVQIGMQQRTRAVITTSWDDGHPLDLKLADMLSDWRVRGTFYVSPRNRERAVMDPRQLRELGARFEIGAHSFTHQNLRQLKDQDLRLELSRSKQELEGVLGRTVDMFCYPKGRYNARVRQSIINCGFAGARTTRTFHFSLPKDPWLMPTTICARDFPWWFWYPHCLRSFSWPGVRELIHKGVGKSWAQLACILFEYVLEHGGVWHLWGHSWEIEEHSLWGGIQDVLETISGRDDVLYLTNGEVVRMAKTHRSGAPTT